jgi:NADPH:quinone reductase-like Zn-dependent oxidoreductase/acyl carrier protein
LDCLEWQPAAKRALEPHELEIEVRAAPLNFHDVVSVLGLITARAPLGGECAGVVTRVGRSVERFRPGDAVVAVTSGSFATFATAHEDHTVAKPPGLSFESACAQGLVYLTADRCLNAVAQVQRGERVLVHAAAGGVGNAAIQLCLRADVEIYATVSSEAKRTHLRELGIKHVFSSRTLDFAKEIERLTGGKGIDVVMNSLSGAFVDAGLSLLRPGGRFVEIGKTDIRRSNVVAADHPGVRYASVDLVNQLRAEPRATMTRLGELLEDIDTGKLLPVPIRTYEFADMKTAFRDLASGRNIGKLVLTPRAAGPLVRSNGAYIVTGGSAGVGFAAAEWLAAQGAARVILLGRRAPSPEVAARIAFWREKGVDMLSVLGDAGSRESIDSIVADAGTALRGVIHCANALDDGPASEMTWDRFDAVMRPKALGAWNLHQSTAPRALDFFVLFSSFAGLTGTRGAANYAAANVALDSLAHLRKHLGLAAMSLNWGAWADIGWAARRPGGAQTLPGFNVMKPDLGVRAMSLAMSNSRSAQLAIAPIDWPRVAATAGRNAASLLEEFISSGTRASFDQVGTQLSLADLIATTAPVEVRTAVIARIRIVAAGVLGIDEAERIDPRQPLQEMGLDSILAVDLRSTLSHSLRRSLPATLLFDYPTINSLAQYCIGTATSAVEKSAVAPSEAVGVDLLELIEGMNDDEVDARLLTRSAQVAS